MDILDKIVFIDNIDRTKDIKAITIDEEQGRILVVFRNSDKEYSYSLTSNKIDIRQNLSKNKFIIYLKEIAGNLSIDKTENTFLEKELENLPKIIADDCVLNTYLNAGDIKQREIDKTKLIFPFSFNLSQKAALENAFTNSISVIEGPPGTGKTQTILNIIANIVLNDKTVAVVSNNNEAVKNVIEKLAKKNYDFITAFLGRKSNQEKFFEDLPEAKVDEWNYEESIDFLYKELAEKNGKIEELLKAEREKEQLKHELLQWETEQKHFNVYFDNQKIEIVDNLPLKNANHKKILAFLVDLRMAKDYTTFNKVLYRLKLIFKYGILNHKFLKKHRYDIILNLQKLFYQRQIEYLQKEISSLERKLEKSQFNKLLEEHRVLSERIFEKYLNNKYKESNDKHKRFLISNYKKEFKNFIKEYPVIVSTTHAIRRCIPEYYQQDYLFDYVIIDESSQVDLITGVLAFSCCKNVIIVGDTKQLPQITDISIKKVIKTQLEKSEYDYFNESILSSVVKLYGNNLPRQILREHYRCHPKIIEFCNKKYYDGQLIAYTSENLSDNPLVLCRTAAGNHMRKVTSGKEKGFYSQRELDIIDRIIKSPDVGYEDNDIGVITPFCKQANKASVLYKNIESDTVHKYQGRERKEIILSTVLSQNADDFYKKFVDDPHMINVAVSRAIERFILVTDERAFCKNSTEINDLIRYIEYNTLDKNIINNPVVSVFDLLYSEYAEELANIQNRLNPNAKYKSEEILRVVLEDVLTQEEFNRYDYEQQVLLLNLLNDKTLLTDEERRYVYNGSSVDFVIFHKQDKKPMMIVEVDGFAFHENNPQQLKRDKLKDEILTKYNIPILRLSTNGSGEKEKLCSKLRNLN